ARIAVQDGGTYYCAPFTPGVAIAWTSFNTACWDDTGTFLSGPPTSPVLDIQLVTSTTNTTQSCPFSNFCITKISLVNGSSSSNSASSSSSTSSSSSASSSSSSSGSMAVWTSIDLLDDTTNSVPHKGNSVVTGIWAKDTTHGAVTLLGAD